MPRYALLQAAAAGRQRGGGEQVVCLPYTSLAAFNQPPGPSNLVVTIQLNRGIIFWHQGKIDQALELEFAFEKTPASFENAESASIGAVNFGGQFGADDTKTDCEHPKVSNGRYEE